MKKIISFCFKSIFSIEFMIIDLLAPFNLLRIVRSKLLNKKLIIFHLLIHLRISQIKKINILHLYNLFLIHLIQIFDNHSFLNVNIKI